jgi:hypothetical protein
MGYLQTPKGITRARHALPLCALWAATPEAAVLAIHRLGGLGPFITPLDTPCHMGLFNLPTSRGYFFGVDDDDDNVGVSQAFVRPPHPFSLSGECHDQTHCRTYFLGIGPAVGEALSSDMDIHSYTPQHAIDRMSDQI